MNSFQSGVWTSHHWALHDAFEEDEVQVVGGCRACAVAQRVQGLMHGCKTHREKKTKFIYVHPWEREQEGERESAYLHWFKLHGWRRRRSWKNSEHRGAVRWELPHILSQGSSPLSVTLLFILTENHNSPFPPPPSYTHTQQTDNNKEYTGQRCNWDPKQTRSCMKRWGGAGE